MILKERRNFLKNSFLSSIVLITYSGELFGAVTPMQTISVVHKDLFPKTDVFPGIESINAGLYLNKILKHSRVRDENKVFIREGVQWLNEEAVTKYKKVYTQLSSSQRQKVLVEISDTSWGESWIEMLMKYFLEAMLGDPVYGGNKAFAGWKWLGHQAGQPRPTKELV